MEAFIGIGSFLGGALVTAFGYTLFITSKLASLASRFEDHIKQSAQTCPFHADLSSRVNVSESQREEIQRRLSKIEQNRPS